MHKLDYNQGGQIIPITYSLVPHLIWKCLTGPPISGPDRRKTFLLKGPSKTTVPPNFLIFRRAWILQAKSVNDVTGIGLHETRRALEAAKESMASLKQSELIDKTINWLAIQERKIAK